MLFHSLEPFVILPYKDKQDILFYSEPLIRNYSNVLKNLIYSELPNVIVKDNLIKVVVGFNYVIIFHLYPTKFKEKCSGRCGQNLVIGYIVHKKRLIKNFDTIILEIEKFFETVKECAKKYDIPTNFLFNVNNGEELFITDKLDTCRKEINNTLHGKYYNCFALLKHKKKLFNLRTKGIKNYKCTQFTSSYRLKCVYKYIVKHSFINKEFWILVDCKETFYYNLKNTHIINFINDFRKNVKLR